MKYLRNYCKEGCSQVVHIAISLKAEERKLCCMPFNIKGSRPWLVCNVTLSDTFVDMNLIVLDGLLWLPKILLEGHLYHPVNDQTAAEGDSWKLCAQSTASKRAMSMSGCRAAVTASSKQRKAQNQYSPAEPFAAA